jgi:hypothetical protein
MNTSTYIHASNPGKEPRPAGDATNIHPGRIASSYGSNICRVLHHDPILLHRLRSPPSSYACWSVRPGRSTFAGMVYVCTRMSLLIRAPVMLYCTIYFLFAKIGSQSLISLLGSRRVNRLAQAFQATMDRYAVFLILMSAFTSSLVSTRSSLWLQNTVL